MMADGTAVGAASVRHDGWTRERELGFLEALADGANVARAAAAVGMSASGAYRLRGRLEGDIFAYGWKAAQAMAYYRLRDIALDRIDHGVATPSVYHGEVVATKTVFSDRLLVAMLNHLKPALGTLGPTGLRRPAEDPGRDFAATVEAYHAGIEGGFTPAVPAIVTGCVNGCEPPEVMSREEFLAILDAMEPSDLPEYDGAAGDRPESNDAGVNFA